jgi:hypothetical protein
MNSRVRLGALVALVLLTGGSIVYLSLPTPGREANAPDQSKGAEDFAAKQGKIEAVMTPPKTFKGREGKGEFSPENYSSNPPRDPSEKLVLKIAGERGVPDEEKVKRLLAMIPTLPPDAQTVAMENAAALIPDTDYLNYRSQLLQLAKTPDMREVVMDDSLTRGEELRLPNLLELMRTSTNEEEKLEIREIFEAYLDKDYGPNPAHWEAPLRQWVAENSES